MSQQGALYHWVDVVAKRMDHLSVPQAKVLAAFSFGLGLSGRCTLSAVARSLSHLGKPDTVERRLQRFISNPRIQWSECCVKLSRWVIGSLPAHKPLFLMLLVDETSLQDHLKVMAVSLAYRGKALPLAWWCYRQGEWPMGQVDLILTLLDWVSKGIPLERPVTVVVEADRGIGNSPKLLRAIEARGWHYLVRVSKGVRLKLEDGSQVPIGSLISQQGERWEGEVSAFKKAGWLKCRALLEWGPGCREPWLLLTNHDQGQAQWYRQRWWEELAFKDCKSNGWNWQRSHVWDPEHANRLWLVMALASAWIISMGTQVRDNRQLRAELTRGTEIRNSLFNLGLRYFQRWTSLGRRLPCRIKLLPNPQTVPKSVV